MVNAIDKRNEMKAMLLPTNLQPFQPENAMKTEWISINKMGAPDDMQKVWVLFPSGYEYPAFYSTEHLEFFCERTEINFAMQPDYWRPREQV